MAEKVFKDMFSPYPMPAASTTANAGVSSSSVPLMYSIMIAFLSFVQISL